ncbi:hypothetical protein DFP73DRAFT_175484 [Morchella snyderi]|nr:hypothetical protein DFP73DRAFT_175484 [Morchella snyderi]
MSTSGSTSSQNGDHHRPEICYETESLSSRSSRKPLPKAEVSRIKTTDKRPTSLSPSSSRSSSPSSKSTSSSSRLTSSSRSHSPSSKSTASSRSTSLSKSSSPSSRSHSPSSKSPASSKSTSLSKSSSPSSKSASSSFSQGKQKTLERTCGGSKFCVVEDVNGKKDIYVYREPKTKSKKEGTSGSSFLSIFRRKRKSVEEKGNEDSAKKEKSERKKEKSRTLKGVGG